MDLASDFDMQPWMIGIVTVRGRDGEVNLTQIELDLQLQVVRGYFAVLFQRSQFDSTSIARTTILVTWRLAFGSVEAGNKAVGIRCRRCFLGLVF